jgi:membrane-associated phospholipid phosphatase
MAGIGLSSTFTPRIEYSPRLWLAVFLLLLATSLALAFIDHPLSEYLRQIKDSPFIKGAGAITDIGKSDPYLWGFGLSAIGMMCFALWQKAKMKKADDAFLKSYRFAYLFFCQAAAGVLVNIIKMIVGRARPIILEREGIYGFDPLTFQGAWHSFPSGHANTMFVLALTVGAIYPALRWPLWILAIIIAATRVMVNAHFLSDILAGLIVALLFLPLCLFIYQKWHPGKEKQTPTRPLDKRGQWV